MFMAANWTFLTSHAPATRTRGHHRPPAEPDTLTSQRKPQPMISSWRDVLPSAAGREVRIEERARPSRAGTDVLAALLKPVQ